MSEERTFWVRSMFGFKTQQPIVVVTMPGGEMVQMEPDEARDLALNLLRCAEAAEGDAHLVTWAKDHGITADENIAAVLNDFRNYRDRGKP